MSQKKQTSKLFLALKKNEPLSQFEKMILKNKVNLNCKSNDNYSPLMIATKKERLDLVKLFL